jgi:uncharacterized protein (TIGR00290 family)
MSLDCPASEPPAWVSWSSGKDSALALQRARDELRIEVVGLLTTVNAAADRVAMHAVRRVLLEAQAARLGLPLQVVEIPSPCPNDVYEARMAAAMSAAVASGVGRVVFGDIFLEDVRAYREAALRGSGVTPTFPLWSWPTRELARHIIDVGIRAVVTCVDSRQMSPGLVGRAYDAQFLEELPEEVDPCGERGEFHTFVWDGPGFSAPIDVKVGELVERDGFVFCDVLPI